MNAGTIRRVPEAQKRNYPAYPFAVPQFCRPLTRASLNFHGLPTAYAVGYTFCRALRALVRAGAGGGAQEKNTVPSLRDSG